MDKRELILCTVRDLATDFLFYDRKEDEELGLMEVERAIEEGVISIDDITTCFKDRLLEGLSVDTSIY